MERLRQELSLRYDFNLKDCYDRFDTYRKGYLSTTDMQRGLTGFGVQQSRDDAGLLTKHYGGGIQQLSFADFSQMFLPRDPEYAEMLHKRRGSGREEFSPDTEGKLRELFRLHITNEISAE
jgi:hypothetical protein